MEDIVIRGGMIADGTGKPAWKGDVAVREGRITAAGEDLSGLQARKILDAEGCIVAPGFIDSHAHSDTTFLLDGSSASKLYQGITTEVSGQCGGSPFPALEKYCRIDDHEWICSSFDEFVKRFEQGGYSMAVNQAMLTGHGSLRAGVIGYEDRPVTRDEMETMKRLLRADLEAGAWGMSLGLEYAPGFFADTDELSELASVVREYDGLVPCHMRSEGLHIDEAIDELAEIGRRSGARVHVSHLKLDNYKVHGRAAHVWEKIESVKRSGVRISADMYPYTASCTTLTIRCPKWSQDGGDEATAAALQGPRREEITEGIRTHYFNAERAETCLICNDAGMWPQIVGKTLRYVAEEILHTKDYARAAADIIVRTKGHAWCIFFVMSEEDMLYFLSQDTGIGSDGRAFSGDPAKVPCRPHPRYYGTVPEFFRLARERKICSVEEAVRRVTSKPADMIGLKDRGRIREGMMADITVFDPLTIRPRAEYLDPIRLSEGVRHVIVNGALAMEDGVQTEIRAGRFLRKRP